MSQTKVGAERKRITTRLEGDDFERLKYWADRRGLSVSEYVHDAVLLQIAHESKDYDIPDILVQRINQLIGLNEALSSDVGALEDVVISGFDSLLNLTRGDNYLLEEE